jgi:DNA invertase Pin-like site-specific DNA recombinase
MKVAIYIRVSTRDKQDITKQRDYLLKFMELKENWEVYNIFQDKGISGSKQNRPALNDMLKEIDNYDAVLVYKLDRIGRSFKHLFQLMDLFKEKNIQFISATQNIDTTTPEGKLFFNMLASFAEFEREMIVQRINDGLATAKARGKKLGRKKGSKDKKPRQKYGYYNRWHKEREK